VLQPVNVNSLQNDFCFLSSWFDDFWKRNYVKTLTSRMWYVLHLITVEMVQKNYTLVIECIAFSLKTKLC